MFTEEQDRLVYVAMTRAMEGLYMTSTRSKVPLKKLLGEGSHWTESQQQPVPWEKVQQHLLLPPSSFLRRVKAVGPPSVEVRSFWHS